MNTKQIEQPTNAPTWKSDDNRPLTTAIFNNDGKEKICLQKSWRDMKTREVKRMTLNLFPNELDKLRTLIDLTQANLTK